MKSLSSCTDSCSSWKFLISILPSAAPSLYVCFFSGAHQLIALKTLMEREVCISKVLWEEHMFKLYLHEENKKIKTHLFCGHLELEEFCLSTQYIPWCMYFYKSNPMDFGLKKKKAGENVTDERKSNTLPLVIHTYLRNKQSIRANMINLICLRELVSNNRTNTEHLTVLSCYRIWLKKCYCLPEQLPQG